MATMATRVSLLAIVWLVLGATSTPKAEAVITCGQVVNSLSPCFSYVMYGGGTSVPPAQCCNGIKNLYAMAQTKPDRQAVCNCIKNAVTGSGFNYSPGNLNLAAGLPKKCHVNIPYQISPNIDCNSVQ